MADLIDRAATLKEIYKIGGNPWSEWETAGVINLVYRQPLVDAVEVVRCCDCKHYKPQNQSAHWKHSALLCIRSANIKMPPDGFCSRGERRTDADN